jgi:hypothetical protein
MKRILVWPVCLVLAVVSAVPASADWQAGGAWASISPNYHGGPLIVADDQDGAFVFWYEFNSLYSDIFAQRYDRDGNLLWGNLGVNICNANIDQYLDDAISDGVGGAFVVWTDYRAGNADIYAQHVRSDGSLAWAANGVVVCDEASASQLDAFAVLDGQGGIIVAWEDSRNIGFGRDVYGQRIGAAGNRLWAVSGVALCLAAGHQQDLNIVTDGSGGAIVVWEDNRGVDTDLYAGAFTAGGAIPWAANGVPVVTATSSQIEEVSVSDDTGGVITAWADYRSTDPDIYAQRLDKNGAALWGTNGRGVSTGSESEFDPSIVRDGEGGAIIAWSDLRNMVDYDPYAQRMTADGYKLWDASGTLLCSNNADVYSPDLVADGEGGAYASWSDHRAANLNVYVQRVDAFGYVQYSLSGSQVLVSNSDSYVLDAAPAGDGFFFVAVDNRSGYQRAYGQRVDGRYGWWHRMRPVIDEVADNPDDQGGEVIVRWRGSGRDDLNEQLFSHYSVWRSTTPAPLAVSGLAPDLVTLDQVAADFSGPALRVEKTVAGEFYWELVGTQQALYTPYYSLTTATRQDSVGGTTPWHHFQVVAHYVYSDFTFWPSEPDSGYSVDNLAPASPLMLAASRIGGDNVLLEWNSSGENEADFSNFVIYRATMSGVDPTPVYFLGETGDTTAVDSTATSSQAFWYVVTAKDVHENQSDPSNEASVTGGPTGVDSPTPSLASLQLQPNVPNPFSGTTSLRIGLPGDADVALEVYDVAGRRVFSRELGTMPAGWREVSFAGRDRAGALLPSGVYFYRITAGRETMTRKMVISR